MLLTSLALVILPILLVNLGGVWLALSALLNPVGTLLVVGAKFAEVIGASLLPMLGRLVVGFLGLTGPIGDTLAARIDGVYFKRDGFYEDVVNDVRVNDRDRYTQQEIWELTREAWGK